MTALSTLPLVYSVPLFSLLLSASCLRSYILCSVLLAIVSTSRTHSSPVSSLVLHRYLSLTIHRCSILLILVYLKSQRRVRRLCDLIVDSDIPFMWLGFVRLSILSLAIMYLCTLAVRRTSYAVCLMSIPTNSMLCIWQPQTGVLSSPTVSK